MRNYLLSVCLGLIVLTVFSCSSNETSTANKAVFSNLNQDITNKTIYILNEADIDFTTIERFSKYDKRRVKLDKIDSVNKIVHHICKIVDSHIEWAKNNVDVELFYEDENRKEEISQIEDLMKKVTSDFFQLVDSNTYLGSGENKHNQTTVKYLQDLLKQSYYNQEAGKTTEAFEIDCRMLKLNLVMAVGELNEQVLQWMEGDGMVIHELNWKVLFDALPKKDSVQCNIVMNAQNNYKPNIYLGKIDEKQFQAGEKYTKAGEVKKIPIIGNYKRIPIVDGTGRMNISSKDFYEKEIEGVIELPSKNGLIYMRFRRNLNKN